MHFLVRIAVEFGYTLIILISYEVLMIASGIVINWYRGKEYIKLDPDAPPRKTVITTTLEWWPSEQRFVQYNTISRIRRLSDGTAELILTYSHSENQHIDRADACWGKSTIKFKPNAIEGLATWLDYDNSANNGTVQWQRLSDGLFKEPKREYYSRLKREQEIFRSAIMTYDQCCTLSGESTSDALEAAHIIPSKNGGAEVIENGILLRADLHRLYDSGGFSIDESGCVVGIKDLSETYQNVLSTARLPELTVARVKDALTYQWRKTQSG
ncbi:hypothetical protein THIOKS13300009 [Thiocapsa sp. KS1]|nr:HNH endonuclease signature motif containing protein [Thiocapsa sp. KS1]CRI66921.1 hypothetical protein THIOKS13300009 [Thiocapsa sp. KS1]